MEQQFGRKKRIFNAKNTALFKLLENDILLEIFEIIKRENVPQFIEAECQKMKDLLKDCMLLQMKKREEYGYQMYRLVTPELVCKFDLDNCSDEMINYMAENDCDTMNRNKGSKAIQIWDNKCSDMANGMQYTSFIFRWLKSNEAE